MNCENETTVMVNANDQIIVPNGTGYLITITISQITPYEVGNADLSYVLASVIEDDLPKIMEERFHYEFYYITPAKFDPVTNLWNTHIEISN